MNTRLLAIILALVTVSGCSSLSSRWIPDAAVADAEHDISSGHIRFAYVGGFVPVALGVPEDNYGTLERYGRLKVGPQGCVQDEHWAERHEYARRYNEIMWGYVSKQH